MRYYRHESPDIGDYCVGSIYQEVDWDKDLVVRQVTVSGSDYQLGEWTGSALVGFICDQEPSTLGIKEEEAISQQEFEDVWRQGKAMQARSSS